MIRNPDLQQRKLVRLAEHVLREKGLLSLPVDLKALAEACSIPLQAMDADEDGVSGMLLRFGNTFGIRYATHIPSEGFQRFSIAHEFGHYFAEGHLDHIQFEAGIHSSRAGFVSADPYEREAGLYDDADEDAVQNRRMIQRVQGIARQVAMDPHDGMDL